MEKKTEAPLTRNFPVSSHSVHWLLWWDLEAYFHNALHMGLLICIISSIHFHRVSLVWQALMMHVFFRHEKGEIELYLHPKQHCFPSNLMWPDVSVAANSRKDIDECWLLEVGTFTNWNHIAVRPQSKAQSMPRFISYGPYWSMGQVLSHACHVTRTKALVSLLLLNKIHGILFFK